MRHAPKQMRHAPKQQRTPEGMIWDANDISRSVRGLSLAAEQLLLDEPTDCDRPTRDRRADMFWGIQQGTRALCGQLDNILDELETAVRPPCAVAHLDAERVGDGAE